MSRPFKALYCLEVLGLDVTLYGATVTPPRLAALRFTIPYTFYAHQLVARRAVVPLRSLRATLWRFLDPFTADMWAALICMLVIQSSFYFYYEMNDRGAVNVVKAERRRSRVKACAYTAFLAAMSVVGTNNHVPSSISGRAYQAVASFCVWIIMAAYLANLRPSWARGPWRCSR